MNRTSIFIFLIFFFFISCSQAPKPDVAAVQKDKKYSIDSLINKERKLIAMAKISGRETIGPMSASAGLPVETIYNIFKNKKQLVRLYGTDLGFSRQHFLVDVDTSIFSSCGHL